ncbi:MAG TPA: ParB N-terminal domain-containing protein [Solirubrobacteraceae bacterium]|nr:ParB N-terminal domain-containing protein [Solirubrobacteraceae bacterium]
MVTATDIALEIDLHRLELRFAETRLPEPRAIERLAQSIEQCGQLIPCVAVPADGAQPPPLIERWVLIDGYRRVAALKRLGRDTAQVQVWRCELAHGLLQALACAQARRSDPIEEALLLRELLEGFGLTQHELARRSGRNISWVNRRLTLLTGLPQECLAAVRTGTVSCWAATRVLAPLARANATHAAALLKAAREQPLSTRELSEWFAHYQRASRPVRERMVVQPGLFLKALRAREQEHHLEQLRSGPEGQILSDLRHLDALIGRLRERLAALTGQELPREVLEMLRRLRARWVSWCQELGRYEHDQTGDPERGTHALPAKAIQPARDHARTEALP